MDSASLPTDNKRAERFHGVNVLVTGAGSGLGREIARRFAVEGAAVACADVNPSSAARVAEELAAVGARALPLEVDVSRWDQVASMVDQMIEAFGSVDVLVANAGISGEGAATEVPLEVWANTIAVNLTGVLYCARAVLPHMVRRGHGVVINQASVAGIIALPRLAAYSAAKGGVIALTRQMALDYAASGIRINAICPGTVPTPLVRSAFEKRVGGAYSIGTTAEEAIAASSARVPLGRLGTEEDIAALTAFLASDEAAWITGAVYPIDGGMSLGTRS